MIPATFSNGYMNWAPPLLLQVQVRMDPSGAEIRSVHAVDLEAEELVVGTKVISRGVDA